MKMPIPISSPTLSLDVDDLVDWLELTALFDQFSTARLDALVGSLSSLEEEAENNIGDRDRRREQLVERLENEVEFRRSILGDVYPFELTSPGDELLLRNDWRDQKFTFYLICLVATHVTSSSVLRNPPVDDLLRQLRNRIFQIIATLGMAGVSRGPAFSVGWPRKSGETILQLLARAAEAGGGFTVRNPPGIYVSPHEKDGGVDVIAWTLEGRPPPTAFYFGQTASGRNWPGKPVADHARIFTQAYMTDHMTGNCNYFTLIPYRVLDELLWQNQHLFHRGLLDRLRLPLRAWQGLQLAWEGVPVDEADRVGELSQWLTDFINYAQAA